MTIIATAWPVVLYNVAMICFAGWWSYSFRLQVTHL